MTTLCSVADCYTAVRARGWCAKHYQRWSLRGSLADPVPPRGIRVQSLDVKRTCRQCGRLFSPSNQRHAYCDGHCAKAAMAAQDRLRYASRTAGRDARLCGRPFCDQPLSVTAHGNQRFCSSMCTAAAVRSNGERSRATAGRGSRGVRPAAQQVRACAVCEQPFPSLHAKQTACDNCCVARQARHATTWSAARRLSERDDSKRVCKTCGTAMSADTHAGRRRCDDCLGTRRGVRGAAMRRDYKLSSEQYDAMAAAGCGICGVLMSGGCRRLAVDHDHACCPGSQTCGGCIRGLLCDRCNRGLGLLGDSAARLRSAAAYLDSAQTRRSA